MHILNSSLKYKDDIPSKTIHRIRSILNDLNLMVIETNWQQSVGCYSVSIQIPNCDIAANGKGTTYEYALASAYGELMERLQNQAYFRLNVDLSSHALKYQNFFYAPDEKKMSSDELLSSNEEWITAQQDLAVRKIDEALLIKWQQITYEKIGADFIAVPYINIFSKQASYIPVKMAAKMYMSNGMCAGNTPEEALVQGISEILERYVNVKIITDKITPPTVSREYIKRFSRIEQMIERIEQLGQYAVIVKDCSLGMNFPVVAVQFINKATQKYFIKFGAHPIFEIALERTLTELFQGQEIFHMQGESDFSFGAAANEKNNIMSILVNGSGCYPTEFFGINDSYVFKEFEDLQDYNNKQLLQHLAYIIISQGFEIFIRDVSFLKFPAFHVVIPGLSEIEAIDNMEALDDYSQYNAAKTKIRCADSLTAQDIQQFREFINKSKSHYFVPVNNFINLSMNGPLPWYYLNISLFTCALYFKMGLFQEPHKILVDYVNLMHDELSNDNMLTFYKALRDICGAKAVGMKEADIIDTLGSFYNKELIRGMVTEFSESQQIFERYGKLQCWDCSKCYFVDSCSYPGLEKVYKIIKDQLLVNAIDQKAVCKIL